MKGLTIIAVNGGYVLQAIEVEHISLSSLIGVSESLDGSYAHIPEDTLFGQVKNFFKTKEIDKTSESP